jgi:HAD superfamily phosphatase (TIGR01668 family)
MEHIDTITSIAERYRPDEICARVEEIDPRALASRGVRGVLLDLDNTITPWQSTALAPAVAAWVAAVKDAGVRACILSNAATARRVRPVALALDIPFVTRALKPLPFGFRAAMRLLDTTPDTTAAIGDQLFTDILGGKRLGLYTILVDPISPREALFTRLLQRTLERAVGRPQRARDRV